VSSGAISIYADSITIEKPAMHVKAVGHVIIEDGKQRRQGNEATVEFDAADPVSTLTILGAGK
jgi:lipopolysaccharide assembly outer membrane protein LptD (OstA)